VARLAFEELLRVAEAQLDAAKRLDGAALNELTEARRRMQEELDVRALRATEGEEREAVRALATRLQAVDRRTLAVGQNVLQVVSALLPDVPPTTYGRRGQLRGT
jgi:hypothetical protein